MLNASSLTLLPVSIFMYRAQAGAHDPTLVFVPILLATSASTLAGFLAVAFAQKIRLRDPLVLVCLLGAAVLLSAFVSVLLALPAAALAPLSSLLGNLALFAIVLAFLVIGAWRKVPVYESFVDGARQGFEVARDLLPYLVAMLCAVGVLRASGALDFALDGVRWCVHALGLDTRFVDALPTALVKPLSGSAARAMLIETMKTHGVDSFPALLAATVQGSTETTFYVLAVYFGAVGIRRTRPGAAYALLLHRIVGVANARGIDHRHRIAVEIELHLDHIARGASMRRHDRHLAPRQCIHQRRLADIRRAGNRNNEPFAQTFTSRRCRKGFLNLVAQRRNLRQRRRHQFFRHIAFVGKIDPRFDQRRGFNDLLPPASRFIAKHTLQLPQRLPPLLFGVRTNQIVEALGFGKIELAVFESAAREFARLGGARIPKTSKRIQQSRQYRPAAMDMKLGDIFAGRTRRRRKPQRHRVIKRFAAAIAQRRSRRHARLRCLPDERRNNVASLRSGYAHDGNRRRRTARRQCEDGLLSRMHVLSIHNDA